MIKKIFIIFFFITACGYQPIYIKKNEIKFSEIIISGYKQINRKILSLLSIKKDNNNNIKSQILIESNKNIIVVSKDTKGQPASYQTILQIKLSITENNRLIKTKTFSEDFTYNNIENKYDLSTYQNDVENNLINKIVEDIIIFLNL